MTRLLIIAFAWIAMLFASFLPFVVWRVFLHHSDLSPWIAITQLSGLGIVLVLALVSSAFRPLQGMVLALVSFVIGDWIRYALENTPAIMNWIKTAPQYDWIFLDSVFALIPGLLMAGLTPDHAKALAAAVTHLS
jgi:ABC-type branched-subunit amino acid transport system permease subunit